MVKGLQAALGEAQPLTLSRLRVSPLESRFPNWVKGPNTPPYQPASPGKWEPSVGLGEAQEAGGGARRIAHPKCLPKSRTAGPSLNIWSPSHSCSPSPPSFWDCPKPCPTLAPPSPISGKFRFQDCPAGETEMCMGKCHEEKHILPSAPKPAQTLEQCRWPGHPPTTQGQG